MTNIGVDIDDVVLDTSSLIISELKKIVGDIEIEKIQSFELEKHLDIDKRKVEKVVKNILELNYIPPIEGAIEGLKKLGEKYKPIYFISNKKSYLYEHNLKLLDNLNLDIDYELHLCTKTAQGVPNKARIINDLNITLFIEDRSDTIEDIIKRTSSFVFVFDKPWNRQLKTVLGRMLRVKDWEDLLNTTFF